MKQRSFLFFVLFFCLFFEVRAPLAAEPKRVLITGGAGMIGSHLCERLLCEGCEVICLDNLTSGSLHNIERLFCNSNFTFIEHDITQYFDSPIALDEIYNLACPASPVIYQKDPVHTVRTSFLGALNMLELALKYGAKIFQASTSEIYGDPLSSPQRETDWGNVNPIGIRACYDEGKRVAETLFFDFNRLWGVRIKVARIFNTYGPGLQPGDGRVVSNFIVQALTNQALTIYGKGTQTRSFCYIEDLVDGILALMNTPDDFTGPVNLGNPSEVNMLELAQKVLALTFSSSKLIFKALPQDDPRNRCPDISLAKSALGWHPTTDLEQGLRATISYFEKEFFLTPSN